MKRIILILAVLALAVPAMADVEIQLIPTATGFDIAYDANSEDGLVRAFALTVSIDGGATIDSVTPAIVGESTEGNLGYGIFPGSITIVGDAVTDDGTPVASGLGTGTVILEMGSLYVDADPNAPGKMGVLCSVVVTGSGTVTVAEEPIRGGVVMEDPTEAPVVDVSASVTAPYAEPWPQCDDYNLTKTIDSLTDPVVDATDVQKMITYITTNKVAPTVWVVPPTHPAYDVRYNFDQGSPVIDAADVQALMSYITANKVAPTVWVVNCLML